MEQVVAKQRIKVATKDHVLISRLHLRLHSEELPYVVVILIFSAIVIFIIVGIAQSNVISQWEVTALQAGPYCPYSL